MPGASAVRASRRTTATRRSPRDERWTHDARLVRRRRQPRPPRVSGRHENRSPNVRQWPSPSVCSARNPAPVRAAVVSAARAPSWSASIDASRSSNPLPGGAASTAGCPDIRAVAQGSLAPAGVGGARRVRTALRRARTHTASRRATCARLEIGHDVPRYPSRSGLCPRVSRLPATTAPPHPPTATTAPRRTACRRAAVASSAGR
jgi:hypothetical protein